MHLSVLGSAFAKLRQFHQARRCIGDALKTAEASGEGWFDPEVHRAAGEIALASSEQDAVEAESHFERALEIARAQQARSWELRAAMSMARMWRDEGKRQQAQELLAPVYAGSPRASTRSI